MPLKGKLGVGEKWALIKATKVGKLWPETIPMFSKCR